jgi:hypothetical protein
VWMAPRRHRSDTRNEYHHRFLLARRWATPSGPKARWHGRTVPAARCPKVVLFSLTGYMFVVRRGVCVYYRSPPDHEHVPGQGRRLWDTVQPEQGDFGTPCSWHHCGRHKGTRPLTTALVLLDASAIARNVGSNLVFVAGHRHRVIGMSEHEL